MESFGAAQPAQVKENQAASRADGPSWHSEPWAGQPAAKHAGRSCWGGAAGSWDKPP